MGGSVISFLLPVDTAADVESMRSDIKGRTRVLRRRLAKKSQDLADERARLAEVLAQAGTGQELIRIAGVNVLIAESAVVDIERQLQILRQFDARLDKIKDYHECAQLAVDLADRLIDVTGDAASKEELIIDLRADTSKLEETRLSVANEINPLPDPDALAAAIVPRALPMAPISNDDDLADLQARFAALTDNHKFAA